MKDFFWEDEQMKRKWIYGIVYGLLMLITLAAFIASYHATVTEKKVPIWEALHIWTLIPPLVAITLAFLTKKNVIISLFLGIMSGTLMVSLVGGTNIIKAGINAFTLFIQTMVNSMADSWNAGILLQVMAIGGLIALITRMGGTFAVARN